MTLWEELLKILEEAESLFGPRDRSYELLEPELYDRPHAQGFFIRKNQIRIYVSRACADDPRRASYELAHEAIHLLSPVLHGQATMLEEGLATHFSHQYVNRLYRLGWESCPDPKYDLARRGVAALLARNESAIKELRLRQPVISKINARLMIEVTDVEPRLARFLCNDFETYGQKRLTWTELLARDVDFAYRFLLAFTGLEKSK